MAREIKFRAWHTPFSGSKFGQKFVYGNKVLSFQSMAPDKYVVEQYTGMKDKELKEIYEGDIVELWHEGYGYLGEEVTTAITSVVQFVHGTFWIKNEPMYAYEEDDLEVKGNIHENPELIKVVD